ncbi:MAG: fructose bisphosphate aldolase [Aestuariivita sp.]|nr:fructose bisphosphate aldolase [Aestuariivita sp.]
MSMVLDEWKLNRMGGGSGFIAALDQSGGSTPKALRQYGIEENQYKDEQEMFAEMQKMRARIILSPVFMREKILGVILFERTLDEQIGNVIVPQYLTESLGMISFLKIDKGLTEIAQDVQVMREIPKLGDTLEKARSVGIFGTKMRSVIHSANLDGIRQVVLQQFEIANYIRDTGLIPIIEPEVNIKISDKFDAEIMLLQELETQISKLGDGPPIMLKLTLPTRNGLYFDLANDSHVLRIAALSGGYSTDDACSLLKKNPRMIASFSRGLTEGLTKQMSDSQFNAILKSRIDKIYEASV